MDDVDDSYTFNNYWYTFVRRYSEVLTRSGRMNRRRQEAIPQTSDATTIVTAADTQREISACPDISGAELTILSIQRGRDTRDAVTSWSQVGVHLCNKPKVGCIQTKDGLATSVDDFNDSTPPYRDNSNCKRA